MAFARDHELHQRRLSRNLGLGLVLLVFVFLVFGLSFVKVSQGDRMHAYDAPQAAAKAAARGQP